MPYASLSPAIRGALAYLDAVATPEQKREAAEKPQGIGHSDWRENNQVRRDLRTQVCNAFKLGAYAERYYMSPLAREMEAYRLFLREDCADAIAAAWCLMQRGEDPEQALSADYDFRGCGILTETTATEMAAEPKSSMNPWDRLRPFIREGDRIAHYRYGGGMGYIVVRGRRLVFDYQTINMQLSAIGSAQIVEELRQFKAAGALEAFFAGKLSSVWPPPGGVVYPPNLDTKPFECEVCSGDDVEPTAAG